MAKEMKGMLKKMAWNTFKNTGSIDTMMELLEMSQIENTNQNNHQTQLKNDIRKNSIKNNVELLEEKREID